MKKMGLKSKREDVNAEGIDGFDWDETQPKWPLTRILKLVLVSISVLVWVLILFRIFAAQDHRFEKMVLLDEEAQAQYSQTSEALRIYPETGSEETGEVAIFYPVYLEKTENLQFTARINRRTLPKGKSDLGYTFILRETLDNDTRYYFLSYSKKDSRFQYDFFRLAFEGIYLRENAVYTFLVFSDEYEADLFSDYNVSADQALYSFVLRSKDTYCKMISLSDATLETVKTEK